VSSPLNFHLERYDGPLDLLLDLIRKQQIDIADIPIATITQQYLDYLDKARELDFDLGAEFVYMAATLIHIKSRMLLPRDPELAADNAAEDPRQELVEKLLEHEKFKNAAEMLQQKRMIEENVWSNPQIAQFVAEDEDPGLAITLFDLVKAFGELLERAKNRPVYEVADDPLPQIAVPGSGRERAGAYHARLRGAAQPARHDRAVSSGVGDGEVAGGRGGASGSVRRNRAAETPDVRHGFRVGAAGECDRKGISVAMDELEEMKAADPETAEADAETGRRGDAETPEVPADDLLAAVETQGAASTEDEQLKALLEAVVYVTEEPLSLAQIAAALVQPRDRVQRLLDELVTEYDRPGHGVTIREVAGGYKMTTKPEHHETVRNFVRSLKPPLKLSLPALETLAVIAYKQPVTTPEIMEIRGVQGASVLKTLLDRKLIAEAGRKNVIGKPILYKTTREFLVQFGLKDLSELPSLKEFEDIRRMAIDGEAPEPAPAPPPEQS